MAKHAQPTPARSGAGSFFAGVALAILGVALAVTVVVTDPAWAPRAAVVVAIAISVTLIAVVLRLSGEVHRLRAEVTAQSGRHRRETASLRQEVVASQQTAAAVLSQLTALRAELVDYVLPIAAEPDPVYPSLHLPLVREAFAEEPVGATVLTYTPPTPPSEIPPDVDADRGSEGVPSSNYVDLTRQHRARHAAGA